MKHKDLRSHHKAMVYRGFDRVAFRKNQVTSSGKEANQNSDVPSSFLIGKKKKSPTQNVRRSHP